MYKYIIIFLFLSIHKEHYNKTKIKIIKKFIFFAIIIFLFILAIFCPCDKFMFKKS